MTVEDISKLITDKNGSGYICVNKSLMHKIGNDEAIVYCELVRCYLYYKKTNKLTDDGYFFCTVKTIEENCNVKQKKQLDIFKKLEKIGLIKYCYRNERKRYVTILCDKNVVNSLFQNRKNKIKSDFPGFDMEIFRREIMFVSGALKETVEFSESILNFYKIYFSYFGTPDTPLSYDSVSNVFKRIRELKDSFSFPVCDTEDFISCCEAYAEVNVEENGYERSMNNMLSNGMIDVLQFRIM